MRLPDNANAKFLLASVLCVLAMALSLIDFTVSAALPFLPGIKLGLANIITLFAIYTLSLPYALMICAVRSMVTALLSGNLTMLSFSLSGGFTSVLIMYLLKGHISIIKVSVCGAVVHNIMQVVIAAVLASGLEVFYYAPVLIIIGAVSGFFMGVICSLLLERLNIFTIKYSPPLK